MRRLLRRLWVALPVLVRRWLVARLEARFTVAVTGLFRDPAGRLLLLRHVWHAHDAWALPGGFLKRGESPEEGLARELREETGLLCKDLHLRHARIVAGGQGLELLYEGRIGCPQPLRLNREIFEGCWFEPSSLPSNISRAQKELIRETIRSGAQIREKAD